ncbi:histidine kinase [Aureisphaera galaxeae]|uniref:sensor histidine kinase n=1 Tax=Aureisphaera galaxeae TaxID=1538023 RepID=UPI0023505F24|nr:histidine kinase [Aureisphaera galaxeae]MDC8002497.1 histidine kinase [Aureisphaera galaxeae]
MNATETIKKLLYSKGGVIVLFWFLFLIIDVFKKSVFSYTDLGYLYYYYFLGFPLWILLTFPVYSLFKFSARFRTGRRIVYLVFIGLGFGIVKTILSWSIFYVITYFTEPEGRRPFMDFFKGIITFHYVEAVIIAWVVLIIMYIIELSKKYREKSLEAAQLESQLAQSKLQALKMQLQPHFLFNAHNTIAMLIRTKKYDMAVDMISGLSDLLRTSLLGEVGQLISLKDELEFLKKYLYIEELRFEDNLSITFDIDEEMETQKVPSLILQPIVENAFKHGISHFLGHSKLVVKAFRKDSFLVVSIFNSGPLLEDGFSLESNSGIGLTNTVKRLKQLYKGTAKLELKNENDGVTVSLYFPIYA